jgi:hypothetical protein
MNKLYCLLLAFVLAAPLGVRAQQADSLRLRLDHILAPLDKSQVPTRLLADYAAPLARLTSFDGTLADSTRTTPLLFRALYATACITGANPLLDLPTYQPARGSGGGQ